MFLYFISPKHEWQEEHYWHYQFSLCELLVKRESELMGAVYGHIEPFQGCVVSNRPHSTSLDHWLCQYKTLKNGQNFNQERAEGAEMVIIDIR